MTQSDHPKFSNEKGRRPFNRGPTGESIDYITLMPEVARFFWGEPTEKKRSEWRWGSNGSKSVNLTDGVWHDHEKKVGGGVLKLIEKEAHRQNGDAVVWLREHGFISDDSGRADIHRANGKGRKYHSNGRTGGNGGSDHTQAKNKHAWRDWSQATAIYDYTDADGVLVHQTARFETPKTFSQRRPHPSRPGEWVFSFKADPTKAIPQCRTVLYRVPEILGKPEIILCEGEKDADRLAGLGFVATTVPMGAGHWKPHYAQFLNGSRVYLIPDADKAGRDGMMRIAKALYADGISTHICSVPDDDRTPVEKADISDWLDTGGDPATLMDRLRDYPEFDPANEPGIIVATPYEWIDPEAIEPRRWIYGRNLIRKFVSVVVAPGATGKSSLMAADALAMGTGRDLVGKRVYGHFNVWIWNLEDPQTELKRHIQATCKHYGISREEIAGRLFVDNGRDNPLCIAIQNRDGAEIKTDVIDALIYEIRRRKVDVLIIDPFISSHKVQENDNNGMDAVIKALGTVADKSDCAICIVHHTRKSGPNEEPSAESSRGAKALTDAARDVRVLTKMSKSQAEKWGIGPDGRRFYFRAESDKANLAPPEHADWYRLVSVPLGNGDDVGVAERWTPPDAFDDVTVDSLLAAQKAVAGKTCREYHTARDWVGHVVGEALGLDTNNKVEKYKVKKLVETWIANGALRVVRGHDERSGRDVDFVEVGEWAVAE